MKKIMFLLIGLGFITFSTLSFAATFNKADGTKTVAGKIVSINTSKDVVVIRDNDSRLDETALAYSSQIGALQVGQDVKAVAHGGALILQ